MRLAAIYRHPVKSLGSEPLERVTLRTHAALPSDRAYAIAHGDSAFDPANPAWETCGNFLRITNIPALSRPAIAYDPQTCALTLTDQGTRTVYDLATGEGREALAMWTGTVAGTIRPGPYTVVEAPGVSMTDARDQAPSVMSLASLRDISERVGAPLDPRRFRGNLWIDGEGLEPWVELGWMGQSLTMGGARLTITAPIVRCLSTAANPETGARSDNPLPALKEMADDPTFGVIATVIKGGDVAVGDAVSL